MKGENPNAATSGESLSASLTLSLSLSLSVSQSVSLLDALGIRSDINFYYFALFSAFSHLLTQPLSGIKARTQYAMTPYIPVQDASHISSLCSLLLTGF